MANLSEFGRIVAETRKSRGMTQDELAAALQITPQAVSKWENGVGRLGRRRARQGQH
ncbi:MAG TPA: helix-turn-helix transcriptional regulator [Clostridiales bacterium]|jgi:transcriptional regulator with XRE-family HTH domain|nr:helix-turn-helix transcriptional regulator [Clostridiales bacterium]